jgi:hypothetical protein
MGTYKTPRTRWHLSNELHSVTSPKTMLDHSEWIMALSRNKCLMPLLLKYTFRSISISSATPDTELCRASTAGSPTTESFTVCILGYTILEIRSGFISGNGAYHTVQHIWAPRLLPRHANLKLPSYETNFI